MRLQLILPRVKPTEFTEPKNHPHKDCQGRHSERRQEVNEPLRDTPYWAVSAHRYRRQRSKWTFRVYPQGDSRARTSQRVKGLGAMLCFLGLRYGAMSLA